MADPSRRLSEADAMFLTVEQAAGATYAPVVVAVLERSWDDPAAVEHIHEVSARLLPAMRRRVVRDRASTALPRWEDVPGFDTWEHVVELPAPGDGTLRAVLDWAAEWARLPMPEDRPHWRAAYFHDVTVDGVPGRMVSVGQTHHTLIDGEGGRRMAEEYLQWAPDGPLPAMPEPPPSVDATRWEHWKEGWAQEGAKAKELLRNTAARARFAARDPQAGLRRARELAAAGGRIRADQGTTPRSPLLVKRSEHLRFDLATIELAPLKVGARAAGGSINDGLMAALSVALHRYHLDHGLQVKELRTAMAMNTRDDAGGHAGNDVIGVMLGLPLTDDASAAMKACHEVARAHKEDADALWVLDRVRAFANRLPAPIIVPATRNTLRGVDLQISNVAGIPARHWVAGVEVIKSCPLPVAPPSAVSLIFTSGKGFGELGLTTDPEAIPDPEHLLARIMEGFAEVAALAPS